MSETVIWKRRQKNRKGRRRIAVNVIGRTPAGYVVVERCDPPCLREAVHPRNLAPLHQST